MKKFKVSFIGRLNGAIGIFYLIHDVVELPKDSTKEQITIKLYDKYEHISNVVIHN